jgi:hypothetical protein
VRGQGKKDERKPIVLVISDQKTSGGKMGVRRFLLLFSNFHRRRISRCSQISLVLRVSQHETVKGSAQPAQSVLAVASGGRSLSEFRRDPGSAAAKTRIVREISRLCAKLRRGSARLEGKNFTNVFVVKKKPAFQVR